MMARYTHSQPEYCIILVSLLQHAYSLSRKGDAPQRLAKMLRTMIALSLKTTRIATLNWTVSSVDNPSSSDANCPRLCFVAVVI